MDSEAVIQAQQQSRLSQELTATKSEKESPSTKQENTGTTSLSRSLINSIQILLESKELSLQKASELSETAKNLAVAEVSNRMLELLTPQSIATGLAVVGKMLTEQTTAKALGDAMSGLLSAEGRKGLDARVIEQNALEVSKLIQAAYGRHRETVERAEELQGFSDTMLGEDVVSDGR